MELMHTILASQQRMRDEAQQAGDLTIPDLIGLCWVEAPMNQSMHTKQRVLAAGENIGIARPAANSTAQIGAPGKPNSKLAHIAH
jgi:hypothetical protein